MSFGYERNEKTYHAVIGKDLDIIHGAAQVLGNLPPDASYRVITVGLQDTRAHAHTGQREQNREFAIVLNPTRPKVLIRPCGTSKVKVSLVDSYVM